MKNNKPTRNFNRRTAKEYHWFRTLFYMTFVFIVVYPFFHIFYKCKIEGRQNIPPRTAKQGKYMFAANHVSELDPPMVSMAALCPIAYMAKKELFEDSDKRNWIIKRLGAFAVDRNKPEIATFKTVRDIIGTTWSLGIFPQGGTRPYGKLEGIKKGFVVIAKAAKADIVPVAIADWDGYPQIKPFKRGNLTIRIGKPISWELEDDVIVYEWSKQISELANYENWTPIPESYKEKAQV